MKQGSVLVTDGESSEDSRVSFVPVGLFWALHATFTPYHFPFNSIHIVSKRSADSLLTLTRPITQMDGSVSEGLLH